MSAPPRTRMMIVNFFQQIFFNFAVLIRRGHRGDMRLWILWIWVYEIVQKTGTKTDSVMPSAVDREPF